MKMYLAALALVCCAHTSACAEELSKAAVDKITAHVFTLNYWTMLPAALLKKCEAQYPDKILQARMGFMDWVGQRTDLVGRVENSRSWFSAKLARAKNQTPAEYEAQTKKALNEKVVEGMFRDFTAADTEEICSNLDRALARMFPDEFTRNQLLPAVEHLEQFRKRLEK